MRRMQSYRTKGITVTYDPNICWHSAVCLNELPAVFDVSRLRWIRPERDSVDAVKETIDHCPSGALGYIIEKGDAPASEPVTEGPGVVSIRLNKDGPLMVEGILELYDENNRPIPHSGRLSLCRCGATLHPPFCDGAHRAIGWKSKKEGGA